MTATAYRSKRCCARSKTGWGNEMGQHAVGIVGLGSMGLGMARNILGAGISLKGYDIFEGSRAALAQSGGNVAESVGATAEGVDVFMLMVVTAAQAEDVIFGAGNAIASLKPGAVVMLCSTVAPSESKALGERVIAAGFEYLDAPVSGGKTGADAGSLTLMCSGSDTAFETAEAVLKAISKVVHRLGKEPGLGATYKVVHQLAAGVHLVVAAELMALGARAGCDAHKLYEIVTQSAGSSWMMSDRVPHILNNDYTPRSMVDIFIKDLGLVLQTGTENGVPLPLSAVAHQMFLAASGMGYGKLDDSAVVKAYEALTGEPVVPGDAS
ncbi:MAG: NAD(P)-binding domain-containing protein [Roseibium sp.]|uniref:L-threonate dehydrogenase n=1 Tax=Roseibium sp. TaxID=1936156 RepID=UPI003D9C26AE